MVRNTSFPFFPIFRFLLGRLWNASYYHADDTEVGYICVAEHWSSFVFKLLCNKSFYSTDSRYEAHLSCIYVDACRWGFLEKLPWRGGRLQHPLEGQSATRGHRYWISANTPVTPAGVRRSGECGHKWELWRKAGNIEESLLFLNVCMDHHSQTIIFSV